MSTPQSKLWLRLTVTHQEPCLSLKSADSCSECGVWPFIDWNSEFLPACEWHDRTYVMREQGFLPPDYTREKVDLMFFRQCMQIAHDDASRAEKAALYYIVVRRVGGLVW